MLKINEETKVFHVLEEFPESKEIIEKYFSYFYENRIEDIALKRLTIKGAFTVLETPEEEKEAFFDELRNLVEEKNIYNINIS